MTNKALILIVAVLSFSSFSSAEPSDYETFLIHQIENEPLVPTITLLNLYRSLDERPLLAHMENLWAKRSFNEIISLSEAGAVSEAEILLNTIKGFTFPIEIPNDVTESFIIAESIESGYIPKGVVFTGSTETTLQPEANIRRINTSTKDQVATPTDTPPFTTVNDLETKEGENKQITDQADTLPIATTNNIETIDVEQKDNAHQDSSPATQSSLESQSLFDLGPSKSPAASSYVTHKKIIRSYSVDTEKLHKRDLSIQDDLNLACQQIAKLDPSVSIKVPSRSDYLWLVVRLSLCVDRINSGMRPKTTFNQSEVTGIVLYH